VRCLGGWILSLEARFSGGGGLGFVRWIPCGRFARGRVTTF
jgi:hypothetical protein